MGYYGLLNRFRRPVSVPDKNQIKKMSVSWREYSYSNLNGRYLLNQPHEKVFQNDTKRLSKMIPNYKRMCLASYDTFCIVI